MNVPLYSRTGGSTYTRKQWRRLAAAIEAALEQEADVKAVVRAVGGSYDEASTAFTLTTMDSMRLAATLCAALARVPRSKR